MTGAQGAPSVSVLIAAWNADGSIRRSLASVLAERTIELECVVVDDASTDGTARIVAEIAASDPRVVLVSSPENEGVSSARNRGLDVVRGEWLTILDADDRFRPGGIRRLHEIAIATGALAVVGQQVWSSGRQRWLGPLYDIPDIRRPGRKSLASAPGLVYYASPHGKLFHRSCHENLRFEGRVLGDQPWIIAALLRAGDRVEVIAETVYDWIRSTPPGGAPSITATTRTSTRRGVEAAGVAGGALAQVMAEAARMVPDPVARRVLASTYADRLLRSDLGAHLVRALDRADPTIGDLFDAIATFIAGVPAGLLADVDGLARDIVAPPLRRWSHVPAGSRPAFRALASVAIAAQPDLPRHAGNPLERWALERVLGTGAVEPALAMVALRVIGVVLVPIRVAAAVLRRARGLLGR
jgi:hypothetical protein